MLQLNFINLLFQFKKNKNISYSLTPGTASSVDKGECMGGSTLSLLHDRTFNYTGDSQAQELCLYLTKAASVPYFEILEKWIYRGIIKDPYRWSLEDNHTLTTLSAVHVLFISVVCTFCLSSVSLWWKNMSCRRRKFKRITMTNTGIRDTPSYSIGFPPSSRKWPTKF